MSEAVSLLEEEVLGKAYDARMIRRLLGYLRPYRLRAAAAVGLIILSSLLELVGPLATAVALDLFIRPLAGEARLSAVSRWLSERLAAAGVELDPMTGLAAVATVYLAALAAGFVVLYVQSYVMQMMGQQVMADLRRQIFAHLQRLPVAYFDRNPVGRLVTRVTNDVDALNELFTAGIVSIFGDIVLLAGIVAVLFWLDWRLALVTFCILPLLTGLTLWFKIRARQRYREVRVKLAAINSYLQEQITGMSVVQLFNQEKRTLDRFSEVNDEHRAANVATIFYYAVYYPAVELVTALGAALILWYGGGQVLRAALSVGALVAFLQYAQRFYRPLSDLSEKYNILQAAMASAERIFALVDAPVEIAAPAEPHRPPAVEGAVEFDGVSFSYVDGEQVLDDVSFRIEPGQMVALVGHTGAGKSTVASLLLRFYDADRGRILVDGVDVRRWDLERLRRAMAMVLQDVFLFAGTVGDNIGLGSGEIGTARIRRAAREVHALEFIERLPDGFDHALKERGGGLSVGQKQLIAFARALAFHPSILILDEATSSVDTETERLIQLALDRLLAGRTSLVIAHRLSTIQRADRILVLHKGCLKEQGTHQELLAQGGLYRRLYELQYQGSEEGALPSAGAGP